MFSIYSSAFNLIKNKFDYQSAIDNFAAFADEVIIAVNKSDDNTLYSLEQYIRSKDYKHVTCLHCDFSYDDPLMDGKIKNFALQGTTHDIKLGLDLDERIPLWQKHLWEIYANSLRFQGDFDGFLIHSLDLWGSDKTVKNDLKTMRTFKWYMHKSGLYRGAVDFARLPDGHVDISKSDTCELIYADGKLAKAPHLTSGQVNHAAPLAFLENVPFVYHLGYVDFDRRNTRNKNFWQRHWEVESGKSINNIMNVSQMKSIPVMPHNLKLWNET